MQNSLLELGFSKTAGLQYKSVKPLNKLDFTSFKYPLTSQNFRRNARDTAYYKNGLTPSGSFVPKHIMPQQSPTINLLSDIYKSYTDKVLHIPIKHKKGSKSKRGQLSLGNIYNMDPNNPNYFKGLKYTWRLK